MTTTTTTEWLVFQKDNCPPELKGIKQWVCWKVGTRKGKPTKVPINPNTGQEAKPNDASTWGTLGEAITCWIKKKMDGIGFVFTEDDPYVFVDLDKCRNPVTGITEEWAQKIIDELDTYTELSVSGRGHHLIFKGKMTGNIHRRGRVEIYDNLRYATMTFHVSDRAKIQERDAADLERRLGELDPAIEEKRQRDESASGEEFRFIKQCVREAKSRDPITIETYIFTHHPEYHAEREEKKGPRSGESWWQYTIKRWLARNPEQILIQTEKGVIKPILANAITLIRDDELLGSALAFNELTMFTVKRGKTPWSDVEGNWTNYDDSRLTEWLHHLGCHVNKNVAADAAQTVACENPFHPVRNYLAELKWDKQQRLATWLTSYLGVEANAYTGAVGKCWLISAVARVMRPGCQADYVLLLQGPQGNRKSTALRTLFGDKFYNGNLTGLEKDKLLELHSAWCVELAELANLRRADHNKVKAFITNTIDTFRAPYDRRPEQHPRANVFAGSINDDTPFTDETGNRRYWPVLCGTINLDELKKNRDQLWAEAVARYNEKEHWWLDDATELLARQEQDQRYQSGQWDDEISKWIANRQSVTVQDILLDCIGKKKENLTAADQLTVARCLKHLGWTVKVERVGKGTARVYRLTGVTGTLAGVTRGETT